MSSLNVRKLHISSCACCLVAALAAGIPGHPDVYPNCTISLCLTQKRHHKYWSCPRPVDGFGVNWARSELQFELLPEGRSFHAHRRFCIPSFVFWSLRNVHALSFSSGPFTMISLVLVATPMKSPYCDFTSSLPACCTSSCAGTISSLPCSATSVRGRPTCLLHRRRFVRSTENLLMINSELFEGLAILNKKQEKPNRKKKVHRIIGSFFSSSRCAHAHDRLSAGHCAQSLSLVR